METKTYFASSVQAAIDVARRELGEEAMLVGSSPSPENMCKYGKLEVTFAWQPGAPAASAHVPSAEPPRRESGMDDILLEISALRAAIGRTGAIPMPVQPTPAREADPETVNSLCGTGFGVETAREIVSAAMNGTGNVGVGIAREIASRLKVAEFAPLQPEETRTLAFIGPPGRGKTSSLIKIAVQHGLANHIPIRIFTAGAHAVGAWEQMARYASILGVPFQATDTFESLNLALQGDRWKGLVLIDTPGLILSDRREMEAMQNFFARRSDIEKHLVIRADARSADMQYMLTQFAPVQPTRLLFTGVDEARGLGAAAETIIRSGIAASFFGTGSRIPEDLEAVNLQRLVRSLWAVNRLAAAA